jgi:hypothetical protein
VAVHEIDAGWVWLVDPAVAPEDDALDRLLAARDDLGHLPEPVMLASRVLTASGAYDPAFAPVFNVRNPDLAVAAVERRLVSLRVLRPGSLLVRRHAGLPTGDGLEWSARLLRHEPGYLVPASVAMSRGAALPWFRGRVDLLLGDALDTYEKPWFAFRLIEGAAAAARRGGRGGSRRRRRG